jgi:transcription elongation factor
MGQESRTSDQGRRAVRGRSTAGCQQGEGGAVANTSRRKAGKRGGKSPAYEDWSKGDLYQRAKEIGIEGRSGMKKSDLIQALRNH